MAGRWVAWAVDVTVSEVASTPLLVMVAWGGMSALEMAVVGRALGGLVLVAVDKRVEWVGGVVFDELQLSAVAGIRSMVLWAVGGM